MAQDLPQGWDVTYTVYKDLPPRRLATVKSFPHDCASRPANPLVTLEDRIEEIFYQDVHALLPPPPPPPLPSGSGPAQIDDLRDLNGRGKLVERQQSQQTNPLPPHQTATPKTTIDASHLPSHPQIATSMPSSQKLPKTEILRINQLSTRSTVPRNTTTLTSKNTARFQLPPLTGNKRNYPKIHTNNKLHGAAKFHNSAKKNNRRETISHQINGNQIDGAT